MELSNVITKVPAVSRDTVIKDLVELMIKHKMDLFPVVENDSVIGVVSEKDLMKVMKVQPVTGMRAVLIKDIPKDIRKRKVSDIMTSHPITARATDSVSGVINLMIANNMKRIIIVNENRKLVALVQFRDLLKKIL